MKQEQQQTASQNPIISQLLRAILLAAIVFILAVAFLLIGFEVAYADRVYPGVYVHDIDLSGKTLDEASERLARALPYAYEGKITVTYEGQVWEANPVDLGYMVDPASSAQVAFEVGRQGWLPGNLFEKGRAWFRGVELSPLVLYDQRAALVYLQSIAESVEQPVREASLSLINAEVVVVNGQVGKEVDIPGMLSLFDTILKHMQDAEIPLIVKETEPEILDVSV
jgi:vancomycin resistance protein YoaR